MLPSVELYTDGSCKDNMHGGPGGWGAILIMNKSGQFHIRELSKVEPNSTTNNKMELTAVIEGLKALTTKCNVTIYSDSKYVTDAFNQRWIYRWIENGWRSSTNTKVKNMELWMELFRLTRQHNCTFTWVKGHSSNNINNRCDQLARGLVQSRGKFSIEESKGINSCFV